MQFCKKCGGALNLFETNDDQLCRSCEKKIAPALAPPPAQALPDFMAGATFSLEDRMLVLTAKEGWVLWSGSMDREVALSEILKRAARIHQIRLKRQGTKN